MTTTAPVPATARRLSQPSPAERLATMPEGERQDVYRRMGEARLRQLRREWTFWARPDQLEPPGRWRNWLLQAGAGAGKTRAGAEWVCDRAKAFADADADHLIGLGNRTFGEVRSLQIEGKSGLKAVCERRGYEFDHAATSREGKLIIPRPGRRPHESRVELHTSRDPELARGRNFNTFWHDEFGTYFPIVDETGGTMFTNVDLRLRAQGPLPPRAVLTYTPRNVPWLKDLLGPEGPPPMNGEPYYGRGKFGSYVLTRATLFDNAIWLDAEYVANVLDRYAYSPLGAQEIYGELVDRVEGALWAPEKIGRTRVAPADVPDLYRIAIGVDPSGGTAEAGIIGGGVAKGADGRVHFYAFDDSSTVGDADVWPGEAVAAYHRLKADVLAGEVNYGGDMVRVVILNQDATVRFQMVRVTRGKHLRAEPVSNLWAPNQLRGHVVGHLPLLENEMCTWRPGDPSPNRLDALVICAGALMPEIAMHVEGGAFGETIAAMRG